VANLSSLIIGGLQLLAGAFLLATGVGGALGVKLLLSGALTLISSFLSARTGTEGFKSSPTYGWDTLSNSQTEGAPIPVVYGEHKVAPAVISVNVKSEGKDNKQVLYLLLLVSAGPIESIGDIRLNDTPIASFSTATATTDRLGSATQTSIPDFNQFGAAYDFSTTLTPGDATAAHVYEMKDTADELALNLVWQGGLYRINSDGNVDDAGVVMYVEYKDIGALDSAYKPYSPGTEDKDTWTLSDNKGGTWATSGKSQAVIRRQIRMRFDGTSGRPARGRYTVRIRCDSPLKGNYIRTATLRSIIEVTNDQRAYAGMALLGLRLPAVEQLSSGLPRVTCVVKGRKVYDPRDGTTAWSQNPVLCARDLLLDTTYGLGNYITSTDIDDGVGGSWRTAATACDATLTAPGVAGSEAAFQLDYVLDVKAPAADHLQQMLQTCRGTIFMADGTLRVGLDTAGASARSFEGRLSAATTTRRNILDTGEGRTSLVVKPLDATARSNIVRVQYVDRAKGYEKRTVEIKDRYINVGAITGGPFTVGEKIKGGTTKAIGRVTGSFATGTSYLTYTQDDGATAFATGETITGQTSGASCTSASAPYYATPERPLDVQMYGITRRSQAVREGRYHLQRAQRTPVFASWGIGPGDADLVPGDVVDVSSDVPAWSAKKFTVLSCGFDANLVGGIDAREYDADVYVNGVDTSLVDALYFLPGGAVPSGLVNPAPSAPAGSPPATEPPTPAPPAPSLSCGTFFGKNPTWKSTTKPTGTVR